MNYRKLRGRIKEKFDLQDEFANKMKISSTTLSKKLNGKTDFTRCEIVTACEILDIPLEEVSEYFFVI